MELDALKEKWAEHDRKLDVSIRLNRQLLMAANMNRVRSPLRRLAFFVGLGALIGLIGPVILGQFIYQHWAEPRFVLPAVVLHVWVIANLAASIRQIAMALLIDYRSEEHTSEFQSPCNLVCRLLLVKKEICWPSCRPENRPCTDPPPRTHLCGG